MKPTRLSRLTIRARLTLVYGGLFLLAGLLLLGVTYTLVAQQLLGDPQLNFSGPVTSGSGQPTQPPSSADSGAPLPADSQEIIRQVADESWRDALAALLT
jgi:hypothetical protein